MPSTYSLNGKIYLVDLMFAYIDPFKPTSVSIDIHKFKKSLSYPGWGNPRTNQFYKPSDVIKNPKLSPDDYNRILTADLSFLIIILSDYTIVDGMHRLAKATLENKKRIKV